VFICYWVAKDRENISKVDKVSLYEFKEFLKLELGKVKVRLLSVWLLSEINEAIGC